MTTTKTPEQSKREQLDILNELADVRARLGDAERVKAEAVAAERERCAHLVEAERDNAYAHPDVIDGIAAAIRTPDPVSHVSEEAHR